ncbi:hypothetical protein RJ639_008145 [Escallonia herrerae]|uniref:Uncharacterized protein n=1 Tax=Escallonia herrerae TaxID=1293975 RepID=A0AA88VYU2_9ASTE|nr:hypothetical protein RJ639_008145 [Escallonia herrerae]
MAGRYYRRSPALGWSNSRARLQAYRHLIAVDGVTFGVVAWPLGFCDVGAVCHGRERVARCGDDGAACRQLQAPRSHIDGAYLAMAATIVATSFGKARPIVVGVTPVDESVLCGHRPTRVGVVDGCGERRRNDLVYTDSTIKAEVVAVKQEDSVMKNTGDVESSFSDSSKELLTKLSLKEPRPRNKLPRDEGFLWVFWTPQNLPTVPETTGQYATREKIKTALFKFRCLNSNVLVQFWAPKVIGGRRLLTTSDQDFGLTHLERRLLLYRLHSERYNIFLDGQEEQLGLPGRMFRHPFPELTPDVLSYSSKDLPQHDLAVICGLKGAFALPVFEPSGQCCVGVLELVDTIGDNVLLETKCEEACRVLKEADLISSCALNRPDIRRREGLQYAVDKINGFPCTSCGPEADGGSLDNSCATFTRRSVVGAEQSGIDVTPLDKTCILSDGENTISYEVLKQYFGSKLEYAAEGLGVSRSTLKRICRKHGISRWPPYRRKKDSFSISNLKRINKFVRRGDTPETSRRDPSGAILLQTPVAVTQWQDLHLVHDSSFTPFQYPPSHLTSSDAHCGDHMEGIEGLQCPLENVNEAPCMSNNAVADCGCLDWSFDTINGGNLDGAGQISSIASTPVEKTCILSERENQSTENQFTYEVLKQYFGQKLEDAAESQGVTRSTWRRICRKHGISRWPYSRRNNDNHGMTEFIGGGDQEQRLESRNRGPSFSPDSVLLEEATNAVAHTIPHVTQVQDTVTMKAMYRGDCIRFGLSCSSGMAELVENVTERLPLMVGSFSIKYKDDEGDWILVACDKDVKDLFHMASATTSQFWDDREATLFKHGDEDDDHVSLSDFV